MSENDKILGAVIMIAYWTLVILVLAFGYWYGKRIMPPDEGVECPQAKGEPGEKGSHGEEEKENKEATSGQKAA